MNQPGAEEQSVTPPCEVVDAPVITSSPAVRSGTGIAPRVEGGTCATCGTGMPAPSNGGGTAPPSYVYAIGRVEMRIPTLGMEKELAQATGRSNVAGLTDRQALHAVISQPQNRYLARRMCWVLAIEGIETYILLPRDPADLNVVIEALRPTPSPMDVDVVIGVRGPIAPAEVCNGLLVPIVVFEQMYSFDRDSLIKAIPKPEKIAAKEFQAAAAELFERIMLMTDNAGATDEHRALNYLAVRYPAIYALAAEQFAQNAALSAVEVLPSPLSGVRKIVSVVFSYTNRTTDVVEKFSVGVEVTEMFPSLVTKLSPYYHR